MMRTVLLLALVVAVYSFPKERSLPSLLRSITKRSAEPLRLHKRSSFYVFDKFDTDHNGYLSMDEMVELFYVYGFSAQDAELFGETQVEMLDLNGDNVLSRWEFSRNDAPGAEYFLSGKYNK